MKNLFTIIMVFALFSFYSLNAQVCENYEVTFDPATIAEADLSSEITITIDMNCDAIEWTTGDLYVWMWSNAGDAPFNGTWSDSSDDAMMTDNGDGTDSFTFIPTEIFDTAASAITEIAFLVKADDGTGDNKTNDIDLYPTTGINDINAQVAIAPNPSNGVFNVKIENNAMLEVIDVTGRVIYEQNLNSTENQINLTSNKSGIYFFRITENNETATRKVIIE